jgi:hypothetical protein
MKPAFACRQACLWFFKQDCCLKKPIFVGATNLNKFFILPFSCFSIWCQQENYEIFRL